MPKTIGIQPRGFRPGPGRKVCNDCGRYYPSTAEYFRRNKLGRDGLMSTCKWCSSAAIKARYVSFPTSQLDARGSLGAICPLWAGRCEQCTDVAACWRLANLAFDELPEALQRKLTLEAEAQENSEDTDGDD